MFSDVSFSTWPFKLSKSTSTLRDGEDHLARAHELSLSLGGL